MPIFLKTVKLSSQSKQEAFKHAMHNVSACIQPRSKLFKWLLNKPYVNEVTLRGQNPPLRYCNLLIFCVLFKKGLDLLMLKIWGL